MPEPTTLYQTRIAEMQALANRGRHQSGWGFAYHRDVSTLLAENTELQAILDAGEENYRGILAEERTALIQRADKAEAALARLQAENTELHKRVTEAEAFFLFGAMNRMVDHGTREIMERVDQAEAEVSRLQAEVDTYAGELGFTKNDLGNAIYRAEKAEAEVTRLHAEQDELKEALAKVQADRDLRVDQEVETAFALRAAEAARDEAKRALAAATEKQR